MNDAAHRPPAPSGSSPPPRSHRPPVWRIGQGFAPGKRALLGSLAVVSGLALSMASAQSPPGPDPGRPAGAAASTASTDLSQTQGPRLAATRKLPPAACDEIDRLVGEALAQGQMAGAVVVAADRDQYLFVQAYGDRQSEPESLPMTPDTLFDLASLTKPIATACSVMLLVERGEVELAAPVATYLPEFSWHGKDEITVTDLLLHQGGLIPDNALRDYEDGPEVAWEKICDLSLRQPPGEAFVYTDVGFIVLGKLVERLSGQRLDEFAAENLYRPLAMASTGFVPGEALRARAAATERREGRWMVGEVHDPRAYLMGGVAGHAGLFATAEDLVTFGRMLLVEGQIPSVDSDSDSDSDPDPDPDSDSGRRPRVMQPATVRLMRQPREVSRGQRALGWDVQSPYSGNRGRSLSPSAFGHGGFTGTVFWVDPEKDLVFVFLSNRLHPDGQGSVNGLAGELATRIGRAIPTR